MCITESPGTKNTPQDLSSLLKKTCDGKSLILFESIAISNGDGYIPIKEMSLTAKQYYSRISALTSAGLIRRDKGKYSITILGKVIREAYAVIGQALSVHWKLTALESIESSNNEFPKQELLKLVDSLIDNHKIKEIIMRMFLDSKGNDYDSLLGEQEVRRKQQLPESRNLTGRPNPVLQMSAGMLS